VFVPKINLISLNGRANSDTYKILTIVIFQIYLQGYMPATKYTLQNYLHIFCKLFNKLRIIKNIIYFLSNHSISYLIDKVTSLAHTYYIINIISYSIDCIISYSMNFYCII
jgi:hypothetical protein